MRADNGPRILLSQPGGIVINGRRIIGRAQYGAEDAASRDIAILMRSSRQAMTPAGQLPPRSTGKRLLDVGCGTGTLIKRSLERYPTVVSVTGVDVSEGMLRQAQERSVGKAPARQVAWIRQRGENLDFPPVSFDIVVCASTFHYFKHPVTMLCELHRVLKPGGMLIVEDYSREGPLARHFAWAIRLYDPLHRRAYTLADMKRLLAVAGLDRIYGARLRVDTLWRGWIVTIGAPVPGLSPTEAS